MHQLLQQSRIRASQLQLRQHVMLQLLPSPPAHHRHAQHMTPGSKQQLPFK
jgi:hypothetical protein